MLPKNLVTNRTARLPCVIGIDPGPEESALVWFDGERVIECSDKPNLFAIDEVRGWNGNVKAVEGFAPYGKSLGMESIRTIEFIGVLQYLGAQKIDRRDVKLHLCGVASAKDADVRDALIERFGPGKDKAIGRKATPGPLYGVSGHGWAALAVAVVAWDKREGNA